MRRPLDLTAPLAHQLPIDESDARWKVWRAGRRTGKTVWGGKAAVDGHGPRQGMQGAPRFAGLLQGRDVAWVVPVYPQSEIFWHEFIVPTFQGVGRLNASDRTVDLGTGGRLWIKSAESVGTIRGLGANMGGVLFEEAASYPTLEAFRREIRPILMDNKGWAAWISSPKAGTEFNTICKEVLNGTRKRDEGWAQWHSTPYDNPVLDPTEIDALVAEYVPGSPALREEVFADLLEGGVGLAFPEWDPSVHEVEAFDIPRHWRVAAGLDWGIRAPSVVLLCASDHEQNVVVFKEFMWKEKSAYDAGFDFASELLTCASPWPEFLTCDSAMDDGSSRVGGQTILSEFQRGMNDALAEVLHAPRLWATPAPKGPGSRSTGYNLVKKMLSWGGPVMPDGTRAKRLKDGSIPLPWQPRLHVVAEDCPYLVKTLPMLKRAKLPIADASGVVHDGKVKDDIDDTQPDDHAYDALRYYLQGFVPPAQEIQKPVPEHVHPGFLPNGQRKSRNRSPETIKEEQQIVVQYRAQQSGRPIGGKYGRSARTS